MWRRALSFAASSPFARGGSCALAAFALPRFQRPPGSQHSFVVQCMVEDSGPKEAAGAETIATCVQCESATCFCPIKVKGLHKFTNAFFTDNSGLRKFWPRVIKKEDGKCYLRCSLCANYNTGVSFSSQAKMHKEGLDIEKSKVCKTTIDGHVQHGKDGSHGKCLDNYLVAHPVADGQTGAEATLQTRAAKRAAQEPTKELLNHFAWLHTALSLPISENKFAKIMHVADQTDSQILEGQYLGKHFFNEGLDCLNRVVSESIFRVLKKAKQVAWHTDVGGGGIGRLWEASSNDF